MKGGSLGQPSSVGAAAPAHTAIVPPPRLGWMDLFSDQVYIYKIISTMRLYSNFAFHVKSYRLKLHEHVVPNKVLFNRAFS